MKSLQFRILIPFSFLYAAVLVGLGLILGQLFPIYLESKVKINLEKMESDITGFLNQEKIALTAIQQQDLATILPTEIMTSELENTKWHFWIILVVILLFVFAVLVYATHRILKSLSESVDHVTQTAIELSNGNYRVRAFESMDVATVELSRSVNSLASSLQDVKETRTIEKERLKTLIDNMGSALIMIGRAGEISVVNGTFLKWFNKNQDDVKKHLFRELGVDESLEKFVDHVFKTEKVYRKQLQIQTSQKLKHIEVYGAPVIGKHGHWLGVVIVMHDITELKKLEQVRKDFVANVSHELRTPITSIKGFSETLIDGAYNDENTLLSFLDIIYKESNRLQMLVQDLLELSKIEKEGFQIDQIPTSLRDLVRSSVERTKIQSEEKKMTIQIHDEENPYVLGDANRLIQIIMNLLVNAITYSKPQKTIDVTVAQENGYGYVEIADQGIGMEKDEIPRVFERFYRVDRARSRNSGGTGLGLAIVKHLVETHEGKIEVQSEEGVGTTIRVYIPLAD